MEERIENEEQGNGRAGNNRSIENRGYRKGGGMDGGKGNLKRRGKTGKRDRGNS